MPERISKAEHEYAGRTVAVGERFNVEPQHVELQLALGRIEPEAGEAGYVTRDMTEAESPGYRTRDMRKKRGG